MRGDVKLRKRELRSRWSVDEVCRLDLQIRSAVKAELGAVCGLVIIRCGRKDDGGGLMIIVDPSTHLPGLRQRKPGRFVGSPVLGSDASGMLRLILLERTLSEHPELQATDMTA